MGLIAAYSAVLRGVFNIYVVDQVPEHLAVAEKIGCILINFSQSDTVEQIVKHDSGMID